jgi:hypothetical protein
MTADQFVVMKVESVARLRDQRRLGWRDLEYLSSASSPEAWSAILDSLGVSDAGLDLVSF